MPEPRIHGWLWSNATRYGSAGFFGFFAEVGVKRENVLDSRGSDWGAYGAAGIGIRMLKCCISK